MLSTLSKPPVKPRTCCQDQKLRLLFNYLKYILILQFIIWFINKQLKQSTIKTNTKKQKLLSTTTLQAKSVTKLPTSSQLPVSTKRPKNFSIVPHQFLTFKYVNYYVRHPRFLLLFLLYLFFFEPWVNLCILKVRFWSNTNNGSIGFLGPP